MTKPTKEEVEAALFISDLLRDKSRMRREIDVLQMTIEIIDTQVTECLLELEAAEKVGGD